MIEFWLSVLSLLCEEIVVWLSALSLLCEVIVVVSCLLCRSCFVRERSCVLPIYIYQTLSGGSCVGSPVWMYSGNPSV